MQSVEDSYFYPTEDLVFGLYNTRKNFIQNIFIFKLFLLCILLSLMFEILLECNWCINLQLNRNINSLGRTLI